MDSRVGKWTYASDRNYADVIALLLSWKKNGYIYPNSMSISDEQARAYFERGQFGMTIGGVVALGTRRHPLGRDFVAVYGRGPAVVVELAGHRLSRLVISSQDAEGDVEQDDVERAALRALQGLAAARHRGDAVPLASERARQHLAQRCVVVHDQDVERALRVHVAFRR